MSEAPALVRYCSQCIYPIDTPATGPVNQVLLQIDPTEGGAEWFTYRHSRASGPSGSILRLLYYPAVTAGDYSPALDIRAGAHSDYGRYVPPSQSWYSYSSQHTLA